MSTALFQPRYVKEASLLVEHARRLLHRRRDVLSDVSAADIESEIGQLERAIAERDERAVKEKSEQLDVVFAKSHPVRSDAGWRENCEVLLVAFVLAIAIRAYFLQPFKIPTGSMEPTLNGIIAHPVPVKERLPGFLRGTFDSLWFGRAYVDAVSKVDDEVVGLQTEKKLFREFTRIFCASGNSYLVHAPIATVQHPTNADGFGVTVGREYKAGESIVHGYVDTGDQVFVDKFTYNFRLPRREDVFVFSTAGISGIRLDDPHVKSEFYIKRLAGLPGDNLRIDHLRLFLNGKLAEGRQFQRVMDARNGYRGYSNTVGMYLKTPGSTFDVPLKSYFALGDNSFNSFDSRGWGVVPAENVVGRGLFVYWPFTRHWGPIH